MRSNHLYWLNSIISLCYTQLYVPIPITLYAYKQIYINYINITNYYIICSDCQRLFINHIIIILSCNLVYYYKTEKLISIMVL